MKAVSIRKSIVKRKKRETHKVIEEKSEAGEKKKKEPLPPMSKKKSKGKKKAIDVKGMTFVFTGRMKAIGRTQAKKLVVSKGGFVGSAVDNTTSVVVAGDV